MRLWLRKLPGWVGIGLITLLNAIWLYWGLGEAFYEGWGVPETPWFLFLSIGLAAMFFSVIAIRFPYVGGGILIVVGLAFAIWWLIPTMKSGFYSLSVTIGRFFLSGGFTIVGVMFILDGRYNIRINRLKRPWIYRNSRMVIAIGLPLLVGLIVAGINLPIVLTRLDDGGRSARLIEGNNLRLIWAPDGRGWNWKQDFGGYPSWDALALYGLEPIGLVADKLSPQHATNENMEITGLCAYLDESGKYIMRTPQYIWRMPTVDEISRSLSQDDQNAGCIWDGLSDRLDCEISPDKETPLWAPDSPPVYYWAAESFDNEEAYYVSYTGWVHSQPKDWGNPRHGYRCVREP